MNGPLKLQIKFKLIIYLGITIILDMPSTMNDISTIFSYV